MVAFDATTSFALPRYDGIWSVALVTEKGDCIAAYRCPMRIVNGVLLNGGDFQLTVSGKVAQSGAVSVRMSGGNTSAIGVGRLARNLGHRSWRTASCFGSWTAERRSL
jgi:hypothetical protein